MIHFHYLYQILSVLSFVIYLIFNLIFECMCGVHFVHICVLTLPCMCLWRAQKWCCFFFISSPILFYSGRSLFLNLKLAIQASLASQLARRTLHLPCRQLLYLSIWCLKTQSQDPIIVKHYLLHVFMFFFTEPSPQNSIWFFEATVIK